jgi:hypothetical protein
MWKQFKIPAKGSGNDGTQILISSSVTSCPFKICSPRLCEQYSVVLK